MGQSEDQMKVPGWQQLASTGVQPTFLGYGATFGTMTVPTTVVGIALESALVALLLMTTHHSRSAIPDMVENFQMLERQSVMIAIGISILVYDVCYFEFLPAGCNAIRKGHGAGLALPFYPAD